MSRSIGVRVGSLPGAPRASTGADAIGLTDTASAVLTTSGGTVTDGRAINAANTGLGYAGVSAGSLITTGATTYSTNNQVVEGRSFTGTVTITGSGVTLRNCRVVVAPGANQKAVVVTGANALIEGVEIVTSSGSGYMGIQAGAPNLTVRRCDVSRFENNLTAESGGLVIEECYMHDSSNASNPSGHRDCVELYSGTGLTIRRSRLTHPPGETAVINIAPWFSGDTVNGVDLLDNFLDGGNQVIIADNQAAGIFNVRVLRNYFGGHEATSYSQRRNPDGNDPVIVRTAAAQSTTPASVLWPDTGVDVNRWAECDDLVPNNNGQVVS